MTQKHNNIAIFVPHAGCPHKCAFCDQRAITRQAHCPDGDEVRRICRQAEAEIRNPENTEVAFFGGSFTAIPKGKMTELLEAAAPFIGHGGFAGIRISTRPDAVDSGILGILRRYGVTSIELGAQSMSDAVLLANGRGHTAADVVRAAGLIRAWGFSLGLQMMVGLYKSTLEDEAHTVQAFLDLHPDTVRIYPTVVLKNTELAEKYAQGLYRLFSFDTVADLCGDAMERFEDAGIRVIKCGLHPSADVEENMTAGFYHPAFREICEGRIYRRKIGSLLQGREKGMYTLFVHPSCISRAAGHKKENLLYFQERGYILKCRADGETAKFQCRLESRRNACI